jgi:hypothetical protein
VTLTPLDLPLLRRQPLCVRAVPWGKLPVRRLDLLLLQLLFVCEPASLWEKLPVKRPLKAMWRCPLPQLSSRLSYVSDVSLALVIRPDWAIDLAQYKLRRIRLHKVEQEFLWSYWAS